VSFKEDTNKILDFFDNKELQDIFNSKFIHIEKLKEVIEEHIKIEQNNCLDCDGLKVHRENTICYELLKKLELSK